VTARQRQRIPNKHQLFYKIALEIIAATGTCTRCQRNAHVQQDAALHDGDHEPDAEAVLGIALRQRHTHGRRCGHAGGGGGGAHLDHEPDPKASEVAAAGRRQNVSADGAEEALLHKLRGVAVDGAEGEGLERVSFGHEAPDAALELGVAVPVQHGSMRRWQPERSGAGAYGAPCTRSAS
jgi:hypothetical protein